MEIGKDFNQLSEEYSKQIVESFNKYIDEIYSLNELDDLSLLSSVTQRNTFTSKLFPYINKIFVLNKLRTLENKESIDIQILKSTNIFFLKIKFYFYILFWTLVTKIFPKKEKIKKYKNNLFIEIFENGDDKKELGTHYYPSLYKKLFPETNNICFLINALNINSINGAYRLRKKLLNSNFDYIFYDAELDIGALNQYFNDCNQIKQSFINIPNFQGFDMKQVFKKILEEEKFSRTNLLANFKYHKFLKDEHYHKKSTILLWNENHSFDRALCLANKKRREKLNLVGHAGYIDSKEKNCLTITNHEKTHQITPKNIFKLVKAESEVEYGHAPAFRYDSFFREEKLTKFKENITIAFPLPKNKLNIYRLVKIGQQLKELNIKFDYNFHPLLPLNYKKFIKKNLKQAPSNKKLENLLYRSKILISSGLSGVYLDAFFCGTPSINVTTNKNIDNALFLQPKEFMHVNQREFNQYYFVLDDFSKIKQLIDSPPIISMTQIKTLRKAFIKPTPSNIIGFFNDIKKT